MTVAMLTSMLVTASPAMALTAATVTLNNTAVAQNASWDIRFTVNTAVGDNTTGGNITLTFPSGFTVNQSAANVSSVTVAAGSGWTSTTNFGVPVLTVTSINSTSATRRVRIAFAANDVIGADAQVRIILPPGVVTNPSAAGSYNITVATSNETTAVTSASFSITLPSISPLPGKVTAKNSAGDILYQAITSDLSTALGTAGVSRVELEAGTYNATNTAGTANLSAMTLIGVGAAGTVILTAGAGAVPLTVSAVNVTIQNLTIQGNQDGTANLMAITGNNTTIRNVTFSGGVYQVAINNTAVAGVTTIDGCTFGVTSNVSRGISTGNTTVVTNSIFNTDTGGTGIVAVTTVNGTPTVLEMTTANFTVTGSNFTGVSSAGAGISVSGNGTSTIKNNNFTGMGNSAIATTGSSSVGTIDVQNNTITGSGSTSASTSSGVISNGGGNMLLLNNTISNSAAVNYALHVSAGNVTARFNSITGNTMNARQTGGTANATHNWWGSATGPASSSINGTVTTTPYLKSAPSAGTVAFTPTSNLTAQTTAGVDISTANGTVNYAIASKYAANPETVTPPGTPVAYFDVSIGVTSGAEPGSVTIRFYGNVGTNSKVYYGGGLAGGWTEVASQGVNVNGGYAYVIITGTSTPNYADLGGTPFVITNTTPPPAAPALSGPAVGATNVPTNTGFSWSAATGATYEFQVSTSPTFATLTANATNLSSNVYGGVTLAANTTYFWRVRSMVGMGATMQMSAWTVSAFTTAAAGSGAPIVVPPAVVTVNPAPITVQAPAAPNVNVAAPPPAQVTVNPPTVNVAAPPPAQVTVNVPEQSPAIPTSILWVIILIGAVLIIALIVLIVRTRRVA